MRNNRFLNMKIQKSVKQEFKIGALFIIDGLVIIGPPFFLLMLQSNLRWSFLHFVSIILLWVIFSVFLCVKLEKNGGLRNITVIYRLLTMERSIYPSRTLKAVRRMTRGGKISE